MSRRTSNLKKGIDMNTMQNYTIYCTEEQTRRACLLGAPICDNPMYRYEYDELPKYKHSNEFNIEVFSYIPTTQQMIGWLRKKEIGIGIIVYKCAVCSYGFKVVNNNYSDSIIAANTIFDTYEQAELAAIDAALDYLERNL